VLPRAHRRAATSPSPITRSPAISLELPSVWTAPYGRRSWWGSTYRRFGAAGSALRPCSVRALLVLDWMGGGREASRESELRNGGVRGFEWLEDAVGTDQRTGHSVVA
jgi:hypothetical protein